MEEQGAFTVQCWPLSSRPRSRKRALDVLSSDERLKTLVVDTTDLTEIRQRPDEVPVGASIRPAERLLGLSSFVAGNKLRPAWMLEFRCYYIDERHEHAGMKHKRLVSSLCCT